MNNSKLRRQIAVEAARLMYQRLESEYFTAKRKAAARFGVSDRPQDLPSNREIRDELQVFARMHEGDQRFADLEAMRVAALQMMRMLDRFNPRLIGSVMTGHIRQGSDIDLHVFSHSAASIAHLLEQNGYSCEIERKRVIKNSQERLFTHIHIRGRHRFELTVYAPEQISYVFKSSITGKAIEWAAIDGLEEMIAREHPDADLSGTENEPAFDPSILWPVLLEPLAGVKQRRDHHPEGDALYHSLQAFELAREACPYDSELITAALLHDVGKAIDPHDHVAAGLEALEGTLTDREYFLIAHHMDALALRDGTLGQKKSRRLRESEWFEELVLLREIDEAARQPGMEVCTIAEAIDFIQALGAEFEE